MRNEKMLLQRLLDVFLNENWCNSIFKKAEKKQNALDLREILNTASSNHDHYNPKQAITSSSAFPVQYPTTFDDLVATFFSKVPTPPSHRHPFMFNLFHRFQRPNKWQNQQNNHNQLNYHQTPSTLCGKQGTRRCWGCKQEDYILCSCPEKQKYLRKFTFASLTTCTKLERLL